MKRMINLSSILNNVTIQVRKKTPEILTTIGITGMITSTVIAVKNTPEAMRKLEVKRRVENTDKITLKQRIQATWKYYIVPAGITIGSAICLIEANAIQNRRKTAIATVCSVAQRTLTDYQKQVADVIGEKKEAQIQSEIAQKRLDSDPKLQNIDSIVIEGEGHTLFYDEMFNRPFYCEIETVRQAVNEINYSMTHCSEIYVALNDFYDRIGISGVGTVGNMIGWNTDRGLLEIDIQAGLLKGRVPCIYLRFKTLPTYDFDSV